MATYPGPYTTQPPIFPASHSAMNAINPAIQRTRDYLFRPFRLGRFVLLALVASVTEGGGGGGSGSFRSPFPNRGSGKVPMQPIPHPHFPPVSTWLPIAIVAAVCILIVSVILGYLAIRLRFSYFDCVLDRSDEIAAGWRKYKTQAWRYFVASFLVGLGFLAVFVALGVALFLHFKPILAPLFSGNKEAAQAVPFSAVLGAFALVFLVVFTIAIIAVVLQTAMSQFVLPRMALEDSYFRDACIEVWDDMRTEPGQFALFMLMRLLVPMAASIAFFLLLLIPMLILIVIGVIVAVIFHASPHASFYFAPLAWPGIHFFIALIFMLSISFSGTVGTWLRNYGILFYAGRYPALMMRLWPPPEGPAVAAESASAPS